MEMKLERVYYMPKELMEGVLYVSEEFETAAHLCPCGCGSKVRTPLGPTEWSFKDTQNGPSLYPSIGNWQKDCYSHYWITNGKILWAETWSNEEVAKGEKSEIQRRQAYYDSLYKKSNTHILRKLWCWAKNLFGH